MLTNISVCAAGYYNTGPQDISENATCEVCPIGTWNDVPVANTGSCRKCTNGKTTEKNATSTEELCGECYVSGLIKIIEKQVNVC